MKIAMFAIAIAICASAFTEALAQDKAPQYAKVYSVDAVKVNFTMGTDSTPPSLTVSALGKVNSSGWADPELAPWIYIVPPRDGILDMDFIAKVPTGIVTWGFQPITANNIFSTPNWIRGVRVHASTNMKVAMLPKRKAPTTKMPWDAVNVLGEGMPLPWPFPWFSPGLKAPAQ